MPERVVRVTDTERRLCVDDGAAILPTPVVLGSRAVVLRRGKAKVFDDLAITIPGFTIAVVA